MKFAKKVMAFAMSAALLLTSNAAISVAKVQAAEETTTKDSWVDPGNYTRGWYDSVTDLDVYGNTGTEEDPFEIKSAKDLAGLAYYSNIAASDSATTDFGGKYIDITATKIDLSAHYWYPIGAVQNFKGNVEGNNVVIKNLFIGSESSYETCGKAGLFGTIYASVSDIAVENAIVYSNSVYTGDFVGYASAGTVKNCSVAGVLNQVRSSSYTGGFAGLIQSSTKMTDCSAEVTVQAGSITSSNVGGFIGDNDTSTLTNCFATGKVTTGASCSGGGFAGLSICSKEIQCFAIGDVSLGNSSCGGGFIGYLYTYTGCTYNSYSLGNVVAGNSSNAGGFIGYVNADYAYTNYIENCYSAGSTKAGSSSSIGGFCGARYDTEGVIVYKKDYWNLSATQIINGTSRTNEEKVAVAYGTFRTVVGTYQSYMQTSDFAADLNEYVYQNADSYDTWETAEDVNHNYPYITGNKQALYTITGGNSNVSVGETETSQDMNVYGTLVFPDASEETSSSAEPSATPTEITSSVEPGTTGGADSSISVGLQWGSLEYVYTAGDYDKETDTYADGSWAPKEAGVTDKITITNSTAVDVQASYAFLPSTEGSGNYTDLVGQFVLENEEAAISEPVIVRAKEGDIIANQNVFLKMNGIPKEQKSVTTPELIGNVVVSISKYSATAPSGDEDIYNTETPGTPYVEETPEPEVTLEPVITPESTDIAATPEVSAVPSFYSEEPVDTSLESTGAPGETN